MTTLVTTENAKTTKGEDLGYLTGICYLAPHTEGGWSKSLCPYATAGCAASCLYTAGRAQVFPAIIQARLRRSNLYRTDPTTFTNQIREEYRRVMERAFRAGLQFAGRPNGTSDLPNITVHLWTAFPGARWYDYTKFPLVQLRKIWARASGQPSAHYTYSVSERPESIKRAQEYIEAGFSAAVVTDKALKAHLLETQPKHYRGLRPTTWIDGDEHDLRFLDPPGACVLLKAKGLARVDDTGFVWRM